MPSRCTSMPSVPAEARIEVSSVAVAGLDENTVEAIAQRVVELLREPAPPKPVLVDAQAVADALGVSRAYVYSNAVRLGGTSLGSGQRPRWRFDLDAAVARYGSDRSQTPGSRAGAPRRRRRRPQDAARVPDRVTL
jgi:hypothetical protein